MARMATGAKKRLRRSFTEEFKAGAVRLVLDEGKTVSEVVRDLDVSQSVVGNWVKNARADRSKGETGLTTEEQAEPAQLRRENRCGPEKLRRSHGGARFAGNP
jgi:transposase